MNEVFNFQWSKKDLPSQLSQLLNKQPHSIKTLHTYYHNSSRGKLNFGRGDGAEMLTTKEPNSNPRLLSLPWAS